MKPADVYVDLDGNEIALAGLDAEERRLIARLQRRARTRPDWTDFDNYWLREVPAFYDARGVSRATTTQRAPYRIAQDLSSRLGIAAGLVRESDYRDEIEELIRSKYTTRQAFCTATGLAEDQLSLFLAGRTNLPLPALTAALERIGYGLHIRPLLSSASTPARSVAPATKKRTG